MVVIVTAGATVFTTAQAAAKAIEIHPALRAGDRADRSIALAHQPSIHATPLLE